MVFKSVFVHETFNYFFNSISKLPDYFLLRVSALWWKFRVLPGSKTIINLSHTSCNSAINLSVQALLQNMQTYMNTLMFTASKMP